MRRGLLIGWLLGVMTFGAGSLIGANWYHYGHADDARVVPVWMAHGWEPIPGVEDPRTLRRPLLHLP